MHGLLNTLHDRQIDGSTQITRYIAMSPKSLFRDTKDYQPLPNSSPPLSNSIASTSK
jgi:hypothetical protein